MRREGDGRRLKERRRKRSHTNPFGRELRVNYSSFVFYLDTTVWERGSSKARQPLIDAAGPEGFTHSADGGPEAPGAEGLMEPGIGVGCRAATSGGIVIVKIETQKGGCGERVSSGLDSSERALFYGVDGIFPTAADPRQLRSVGRRSEF